MLLAYRLQEIMTYLKIFEPGSQKMAFTSFKAPLSAHEHIDYMKLATKRARKCGLLGLDPCQHVLRRAEEVRMQNMKTYATNAKLIPVVVGS